MSSGRKILTILLFSIKLAIAQDSQGEPDNYVECSQEIRQTEIQQITSLFSSFNNIKRKNGVNCYQPNKAGRNILDRKTSLEELIRLSKVIEKKYKGYLHIPKHYECLEDKIAFLVSKLDILKKEDRSTIKWLFKGKGAPLLSLYQEAKFPMGTKYIWGDASSIGSSPLDKLGRLTYEWEQEEKGLEFIDGALWHKAAPQIKIIVEDYPISIVDQDTKVAIYNALKNGNILDADAMIDESIYAYSTRNSRSSDGTGRISSDLSMVASLRLKYLTNIQSYLKKKKSSIPPEKRDFPIYKKINNLLRGGFGRFYSQSNGKRRISIGQQIKNLKKQI